MRTRLFPIALATLATLVLLPTGAEAQKKGRPAEPVYDGRTLSAWVADLQADAPVTRTTAAYAIGGLGAQGGAAVPALVAALRAPEQPDNVRFALLVALRELGPAAQDAIPALEPLLDDRSDDIAHAARKALKAIRGGE